MTDYLILGGGLAGCALASRLKEYLPSATVTVIEAGPNEHDNPLITEPMATFQLHESPLEYNYRTAPQKHYNNRVVYNSGGKLLSGSSSVNYATWTRGGADDYNVWGELVKDKRWSYEGLLPFFRKTETHHDLRSVDASQHGSTGPIYTTAGAREYPLKGVIQSAFFEGCGLPAIKDANGGFPIGIAPLTENWRDGKRQPAGKAYGLDGVDVVTNATVARVIFDGTTAVGAELVDGRRVFANREVILCCGSLKTPQLLLLSGIGPREELLEHGIAQIVDSPEVGKNFHDHCCVAQFYKIKDSEEGHAAGSAKFNDPSYLLGMPADIVVTAPAPPAALKAALKSDGKLIAGDNHPHLWSTRGHIEILPVYAPSEAPLTNMNVPFDGTCITIAILNLLPTSRGSVRLASNNPTVDPVIDPNYYATKTDQVILREGMRMAMKALESESGQKFIDHEFAPEGLPPLTSNSTDEELDARVRRVASTWFHPAGSASMGKVVDTNLNVMGVKKLRVVDASVMPCPIGAHLQVATYALAEQAAVIISSTWSDQ